MTQEYINQAIDDAMILTFKYQGTPRAEIWRTALRNLIKIKNAKFPITSQAK